MAMSRSFGATLLTTRPPIAISPSVMFSSPAIMRSSVDLPQPDGPTRMTNSPSSISTLTPCRTSVVPKRLRTLRMETVAMSSERSLVAWPGRPGHPRFIVVRRRAGWPAAAGHHDRQNLETRVSFAVMNSSSAGLPALVCSMPRWIAALIWFGIRHALAIAAERLRHVGVVAGDVGRAVLLGRDRHHLQLDRHGEVVHQAGQDGDALAHRGLEVHAGEADRRVAPEVDAGLVRMHQLGAHRQPEPHAKLRGLAPADIGHRLGGHPERRDLVARAAGIMGDDGVLRIGALPSAPRSRDTG